MSQSAKILEHLQAGNSLTVKEALDKFQCYALSQRIGELKKQGHAIVSKMVKTDGGARVARYSLTKSK